MRDPGGDRREWQTEMEALEPQLRDDPVETLPDLADLVERMLVERGYEVDEQVTREGQEPDVVAEFLSAREITRRCEAGEGVDPSDIGSAIQGLRAVYESLMVEREAP